jgi:hypothetical protein
LIVSLSPLLIPVIAGFAIIFVMIGMLVLVAALLSILALIKLDKDKILNGVNTVMDTSQAVIDSLFGRDDKDGGESKPWYYSIIKMCGLNGDIIQAILSIAFLAVSIVSILLVLLLAGELALLQKIELDRDAILENVRIVMDTAKNVADSIFAPDEQEETPSNKGWLRNILEGIGGSVVNIAGSILSLGFLAVSVVSVLLLTFLAGELALLQKIKLDKDAILKNVNTIIGAAKSVANAIFRKDDTESSQSEDGSKKKGWFRKAIENVGEGAKSMAGGILSIGFLASALASMGLLMFLARKLKRLQKKDLNESLIYKNINSVILTAKYMVDHLNTIKIPKNKLFDNMEKIDKSLDMMVELMKKLKKIQSFKLNESTTETAKQIISSSQYIIDTILDSKEDGFLGRLKTRMKDNSIMKVLDRYEIVVGRLASISRNSWGSINERTVINNKAITENYIKFVDKIDKISVDKLGTAAKMFEKMADFSKSINGNFRKLAESINEDLMPVLEELKETLNQIPEKIDTNAASVSQSIGAYSSPLFGPSTSIGMEAQVNRENPGMSKEEVKKEVDNRLNEQARAQASSLESKFDELIELLKSGMARVSLT